MTTCPSCGNTNLVRLSSHQIMICTDCDLDIPWLLKDGKKPTVASSRGDRRNESAAEHQDGV